MLYQPTYKARTKVALTRQLPPDSSAAFHGGHIDAVALGHRSLVASAVFALLLLTACGGGTDYPLTAPSPTPAPVPQQIIQGVVATGAPVRAAPVELFCTNSPGNSAGNAVTENTGAYRISLPAPGEAGAPVFPCLLRVAIPGGTLTLHAAATQSGLVNITPLSDLQVAQSANTLQAATALATFRAGGAGGAGSDAPFSAQRLQTAWDAVRAVLVTLGFTAPSNAVLLSLATPTGFPFTASPGDPFDTLLDQLAVRQNALRLNSQTLLARMQGKLPTATLQVDAPDPVAGGSVVVVLTATQMQSPNDTIASYTWNFGDASPDVTTTAPTLRRTNIPPGNYTATLVVTDAKGVSGSVMSQTFVAKIPPPVLLVNLSAPGTFTGRAGINDEFSLPESATAGLQGITINGNAADNDVLTLNAAGTYTLNDGGTGGTISNIKALNLAGTGAYTIGFAAAGSGGSKSINGSAGNDSVNLANTAGAFLDGDISLGAGQNTLTLAAGATYTGLFVAGSGTADTLVMPASNNDISAATISGFENLTLLGDGVVTMTATQLNGFTGIITGSGNNTLNFTTAGTIAAPAVIEGFVLANGANTFTAGNNTVRVTGGTGNDTFNYTANQMAGTTFLRGGAGADTLNIGSIGANLNISASVSEIETINVTGSPAVGYTFRNVDGAGVTLNFTKGAVADVIQLGSGGQTVNLQGTAATPVQINGGPGVDTINLSDTATGSETINAGSNRTAIDTVTNFNRAGTDYFKTGVNPAFVGRFTIGRADIGNFISRIAGGLIVVLNNRNLAYLIIIEEGTAAGTYLFQNTGSDTSQFDDTDFFVKLVNPGSISPGSFIP